MICTWTGLEGAGSWFGDGVLLCSSDCEDLSRQGDDKAASGVRAASLSGVKLSRVCVGLPLIRL